MNCGDGVSGSGLQKAETLERIGLSEIAQELKNMDLIET